MGDFSDIMHEVVNKLASCWQCPVGPNTERGVNLPGQKAVHELLTSLIAVLFPGCHSEEAVAEQALRADIEKRLNRTATELKRQIERVLRYQCTVDHQKDCKECRECDVRAVEATLNLLNALPDVHGLLQKDITAAYEGDPAARSTMEIVMSYPGVYAVVVHRIAHVLYKESIPLIPRVMSEHAHSITGIDIHPGAKIGPGFFIDHGTGVVIGETTVIGKNVKLYQGVTLGAMSFEKDDDGNLIKGIKRHPNIEDHVVIYAGATILGGDTTIGARSTIGGNVWLTHSIPPHSMVYNQQPRPLIREADGTWRTKEGPWDDFGGGI